MMKSIITFVLVVVGFLPVLGSSDFSPVNEYVSPEHLCITKDKSTIYVGLSTYPGVAVLDVQSEEIKEIIQLPAPVSGIVLDEKEQILYAGSRDESSRLFVYDLENKKLQKDIKAGYFPEDLALAKNSNLLLAANRFSNDISIIDLKSQKETQRIEVGREPVSLAVSPDEKLLAVANLLPVQSSLSKYISASVSLIDVENKSLIKNIDLPNGSFALKDIIFSPDEKFIYVTHLVGRFNVLTSQIEKGWINTNAVSIINAQTKEYYTTVLLDDVYGGAANPNGLTISEDGKGLFIAISGTHELFAIDRLAMHEKLEEVFNNDKISQVAEMVSKEEENVKLFQKFDEIEQMKVRFKDVPQELSFLASVRKRIKLNGKGASHVVSIGNKVFVSNYFSDEIEVVDLISNKKNQVAIGSKNVSDSDVRYGEMLFHDADKCFQQWQSCASCHPGNGRVDGLNWDLMNDGMGNPKNTKSLLWSHSTPPAMATGIRKDAETGVRAGFKYIQFFDAPEKDAQAVDAYLKSLKPVPSLLLENGNLSSSAKNGKQIFEERNCTYCHSGPYYTTLEKYEIGTMGKYDKQNSWDTPTLIEIWRTAPYLHNGRYNKLEDVFIHGKHGIKDSLSESEVKDLTEYLLSL